MISISCRGFLFAALATWVAGASADDGEGVFRVRGGLSSVAYSDTAPEGGYKLNADYTAAVLGFSWMNADGWFIDLGVRNSITRRWDAERLDMPTSAIFGVTIDNSDDGFSREETNITLGHVLGDGFTAFAGIQRADAQLKGIAHNREADLSLKYRFAVDARVIFVGMSKTFGGRNGGLSIAGALGVLDQEVRLRTADNSVSSTQRTNGGTGGTLAVSYLHAISPSLALTTDLRMQSFAADYDRDSTRQNIASLGFAALGRF